MKACTSPRRSEPPETMSPPTTAMATYPRFPTTCMIGIMMPDRNCARRPAAKSSSFSASKSAREPSVRP